MTKEVVIPSNPADREKIFKVLKTVSESMTRIESERELIKEEIGALVEAYEIPRKFLNRMARTYHRQTYDQVIQETEDFSALYDSIVSEG